LLKFITSVLFLLFIVTAVKARAAGNPDDLYRQGKYAEAEKAYARSDMDNPKDIRFRYNRGCAAFQNSDFKTAAATFSSVERRTADSKIKFKALYNLGNTAFKQGDFESAAEFYRKAIQYNPEDPDSRYNLEVTLREIEKKKKEEQKGQDKTQQKDSRDQEKQEEQSKAGDKGEGSDNKAGNQGDSEQEEKKGPEKKDNTGEGKGQKTEKETPEDLSGDIEAPKDTGGQDTEKDQGPAGSNLDRKRAEAMLDNLKEDRSRFLRFQIPWDKRQGVTSGKDW
jgi:Ca-activated chloride channel family protein